MDALTICPRPAPGLLEVLVAISTATMCFPRKSAVKIRLLLETAMPPELVTCVQSLSRLSTALVFCVLQ
jgi:hypothetical protein